MLPLGFSLSCGALRLFLAEVLDQIPFRATVFAPTLLQRANQLCFFSPQFCIEQTEQETDAYLLSTCHASLSIHSVN